MAIGENAAYIIKLLLKSSPMGWGILEYLGVELRDEGVWVWGVVGSAGDLWSHRVHPLELPFFFSAKLLESIKSLLLHTK